MSGRCTQTETETVAIATKMEIVYTDKEIEGVQCILLSEID